MGHGDDHTVDLTRLQAIGLRRHRLLYEEDAPGSGEAREQVLRTLVHEVPAQVRQTDEVGR